MPRTARVLVDRGYYHIVTRGIERRKLFCCPQDFKVFRGIIRKNLESFRIDILNYCFMPNHLHLLIQAQVASDLAKFMQSILQVYANRFRRKYKTVGYVYQNRYKSKLIDTEAYLLECNRYIERNPLRAELVADLTGYPWSSFSYYAMGAKDDIITLPNPMYLGLGASALVRQGEYKKYIYQERPYDLIVDKAFRIR